MKNKKSFITTVSLLACCFFIARSELLGGWSDEKEANGEIQRLLNKVKEQIEEKTNSVYGSIKAVSYQQQLVNGMNYRIRAEAKPGGIPSTWQAKRPIIMLPSWGGSNNKDQAMVGAKFLHGSLVMSDDRLGDKDVVGIEVRLYQPFNGEVGVTSVVTGISM